MKVLIVNTAERRGGAAIAANRLMRALRKSSLDAEMLVLHRQTDDEHVHAIPNTWRTRWHFLWERMVIWVACGFRKENIFQLDIANAGTDITQHPAFQSADVIHLHWINQGFLSLQNLRKIIQTGKPIVWTMHDMWTFTSIYHYDSMRRLFHLAENPIESKEKTFMQRLASWVFQQKQQLYRESDISFVACSRWLEEETRRSTLLRHAHVTNIPNTLDTTLFSPQDRVVAREALGLPQDKRLLLFGAMKVTDERKGIRYLVEACRLLVERTPQWAERIALVMVGGDSSAYNALFSLPIYSMGYVSDERTMAQIYTAADVFITPSLEDNLPNTIAEALACGTPCVGFKTGGIPEMIHHEKNGYVATYQSAEDLARGIEWTLSQDADMLRSSARMSALEQYSESRVAALYANIYQQTIERHAR